MGKFSHDTLVDGVKTNKAHFGELGALLQAIGTHQRVEVIDNRAVNRILLLVAVRRQRAVQSHLCGCEALGGPDGFGMDGDVGGGEGTGLVRAQDRHGADVLQRRQRRHHSIELGSHLGSSQGHGDLQH